MLDAEREIVAEAGRRLARAGLVTGTAGNASLRRGDRFAVTAAGTTLATLTAQQVVVVDLDGVLLHGDLAPSSELAIHLGVYRRLGAGAIVHSHAPVASALSTVLHELPAVHYGMLALGGAVRVAPYATPGSDELAEVTLEALTDRRAALLANHGTIALGDDLEQAMENTRRLEWFSELYWRAASIGRPRALDDEQLADAQEALHGRMLHGAPR